MDKKRYLTFFDSEEYGKGTRKYNVSSLTMCLGLVITGISSLFMAIGEKQIRNSAMSYVPTNQNAVDSINTLYDEFNKATVKK